MSNANSKRILSVLVCSLLLTACSKGDDDLREWLNEVKNRPAPALSPPPEVVEPPVQVYSAIGLRDPFAKPPMNRMSSGIGPSPDMDRRRQPLEAFSLDSLSMVGTIGSGSQLTALILAPDKVTYRVRPNDYLGQSDGRTLAVYPDRIELLELVPDGNGGFLERQAKITLNELKSGDQK